MIVDGRTDQVCSACERKHMPRASAKTSIADAIDVPVLTLLLIA